MLKGFREDATHPSPEAPEKGTHVVVVKICGSVNIQVLAYLLTFSLPSCRGEAIRITKSQSTSVDRPTAVLHATGRAPSPFEGSQQPQWAWLGMAAWYDGGRPKDLCGLRPLSLQQWMFGSFVELGPVPRETDGGARGDFYVGLQQD